MDVYAREIVDEVEKPRHLPRMHASEDNEHPRAESISPAKLPVAGTEEFESTTRMHASVEHHVDVVSE